MRQRLIGLRRLRISGWLLVRLFLTSVFLINNRELVSGARVQNLGRLVVLYPGILACC